MSSSGGSADSQLVAPLLLPASAGKALTTPNSTLDDGTGNLTTGGSCQAGGAGVRLQNDGALQFLTTGGGALWGGSGAPAIAGTLGDFYFRTDTPSTALQRIYVCTVTGGAGAATWVGIL